ncbi:MAG TPA: stage III sporulation protein AB [Peptococcaceae bacterium]|nr:stage III sporulation protein AB [Peptococcaceae bacterium]HPZ71753.1 stage III sporulation protein AB [Peptococcaceae bacterium]HQD53611.1 stage III sporulation protein AB [Peptococcaceae bacterium]
MCKLLGAILILLGCSYWGWKISSLYRKRTELFRFLQNGLTMLEAEINYTATPLPLALERVGRKSNRLCQALFLQAAHILQAQKTVSAGEAWQTGIAALAAEVPLSKEESEILQLFGYSLGGSDKEEQLKNIALTKKQLFIVQKKAEEEQGKKQKLCQYLSFCLGAVLVLLLI